MILKNMIPMYLCHDIIIFSIRTVILSNQTKNVQIDQNKRNVNKATCQ